MQCLLYVPQYECDGHTNAKFMADLRIGGLSIYQRACRSIQKADFSEIIVVHPAAYEPKNDDHITIPVHYLKYEKSTDEISDQIVASLQNANLAICILNSMISPECLSMRPIGADVRICVEKTPSCVYFVSYQTACDIIAAEHGLDVIESAVTETYNAPEKTVYHRILSADDVKIGQNILTRSLRKPLGRDADGLVAYFINRPCSLQISKRLANSFVTPNMVTLVGLLIGLAAAALIATGHYPLMALAVVLWQISSMVDGIDGELARMRMSPSHKGEWFDTVADDVTNITFMLGLGHGLYMTGNHFPFLGDHSSAVYFYIAIAVCSLMVVAVSWFYAEFVKMGIASHNHFEWGFESENKANKIQEHRSVIRIAADKIAGAFAWIAKRDFYTFLIMCLVLCGFFKTAYFIMLIGASFVGIGGLVALSIRAVKKMKSKK